MKNLLLFEQFISESFKNNVVSQILEALDEDIDDLLIRKEKAFEKHFEKPMSDYDKEISRLEIIYDMVRSIEKYTLPSDTLVSASSARSKKGNLEILASIEREGKIYNLETEVIYAGGYNIQTLHYRYITKTNLPRTDRKDVAEEYAKKIKNLTKTEKLEREIRHWEARIKKNTERLENSMKLSDEEKLEDYNQKNRITDVSWEEIVRRGADKNYNFDRNEYEESMEKYRKDRLNFWNRANIENLISDSKTGQKEIEKLKAKLLQIS
jgi:hypothetical protein